MAVIEFLPRWVQQEWMELGSCKGQTHYFFAPHGEQAEAREAREAIAGSICASCEVLDVCREYARHNREQGFWGGENDELRITARRRANRQRPAASAAFAS